MSRGSYGAPRVHAELRLGQGVRCGRKRGARLMRSAGLHGIYRRRGRHARPAPAVHDDLVRRRFVADAPDRLWLTDITEHPTREGKVYCAAVLDVYSRRIVGWSIADHLRTELVVDALEMARWRRQPTRGETVVHSAPSPATSSRPCATTSPSTGPCVRACAPNSASWCVASSASTATRRTSRSRRRCCRRAGRRRKKKRL